MDISTWDTKIKLSDDIINVLENTGTKILYMSIPDEMRDILSSLASRWRADRWAVGDITNGIKAYVVQNRVVASMEDIHLFVSELLNSELRPRTVRYYARMSEFFSPEIREQYENMPHSHFALALQYESHWKEILEASQGEFYKYGKYQSVEWLERNICSAFVANEPPEIANPPIEESEYDDTETEEQDTEHKEHPFLKKILRDLTELVKYVQLYANVDSRKRILAQIESLQDELNSL